MDCITPHYGVNCKLFFLSILQTVLLPNPISRTLLHCSKDWYKIQIKYTVDMGIIPISTLQNIYTVIHSSIHLDWVRIPSINVKNTESTCLHVVVLRSVSLEHGRLVERNSLTHVVVVDAGLTKMWAQQSLISRGWARLRPICPFPFSVTRH